MNHKKHYPSLIASILCAVGLAFAWMTLAAAGYEAPQAPTAEPNTVSHSLTAVNGRLFLFGGGSLTTTVESNTLWEFHPDESSWGQVPITGSLPPARRGHAAVNLDNKLMIMGGYNYTDGTLNDIWSYDPVTGKWTEVAQETAPPGRVGHGAVSSAEGYVYVFGGSSNPPLGLDTIWRFTPTTGLWTVVSMENLSGERYGHYMTRIGGKVYLVGGSQSLTGSFLQSYTLGDWGFNDITPTNPGPSKRYNHAGATAGNDIYIFGGHSITNSRVYSDSWKYNTVANAWTQLPNLPQAMSDFQAAVITGTYSLRQGPAIRLANEPKILLSRGIAADDSLTEYSYIFDGTSYLPVVDGPRLFLPFLIRP